MPVARNKLQQAWDNYSARSRAIEAEYLKEIAPANEKRRNALNSAWADYKRVLNTCPDPEL